MSKQRAKKVCQQQLDRYFAARSTLVSPRLAFMAVELLAEEQPLPGKPQAWAAGIIYAIANLHRYACGIPGLLNSEAEEFFGVSMETIRRRAAKVATVITPSS